MSSPEAALRWWLALTVVAAAMAPLTWWMAAGLGRFRHSLLRPVGLVLATFLVWWPAALSPLPFNRLTVVIALALGGAAGWIVMLRRGRSLLGDLRTLLLFEAVWVLAFGGYLWFRSANPDIANTEKPMEIALLSSVARSSDVPAPDPWFAGEPINYYYFGYQSIATLVHLTGVSTTVAFNLALGMLFASVLVVAAGLGGWLAAQARLGAWAIASAAALSAFFVALAGNLETFTRLARDPGSTVSAGWWDGVGWQASRVIVDSGVRGNPAPVETINEFPAFSFVLGDLHPHVTTLPVLLTCVALAGGLAARRGLTSIPRCAAVGAFAGLLYASNSWDAPVGVAAVLAGILMAGRALDRPAVLRLAAALGGAVVAAFPFAWSYTAPVGVESGDVPGWLTRIPVAGSLPNTIAVVDWRPSSAAELLTVHGVWIVAGTMLGTWALLRSPAHRHFVRRRQDVLLPLALILVAAAVAWAPALVLLGFPLLVMCLIAVRDHRRSVRLVAGLYAAGFGLALIPEFLYIQDAFGNRMNTVFKLHFQAWLFFGVATGAAAVIMSARLTGRARMAGTGLFVVLVAIAAPYSPLSAEDWAQMGTASGTLDGAAYLHVANPDEAAAIAWLDERASDGDVLVEAPGCAYQSILGVPMNRFSAFTGVPALLGWANHERQWRRGEFADLDRVLERRNDLALGWLIGEAPPADAAPRPRFIILGAVERNTSERCPALVERGTEVEARLASAGWITVFHRGQSSILVDGSDPLAFERD